MTVRPGPEHQNAGPRDGGPRGGGPGNGRHAEGGHGDDVLGYQDLGYARVDTDREGRQGLPEVIYGSGKTPAQIAGIAARLLARNTGPVLATRIDPETAVAVSEAGAGLDAGAAPDSTGGLPDGTYHAAGRLLVWRAAEPGPVRLVVATAGTADAPVADEAAAVSRALGLRVDEVRDVGVAGIHRLLAETDRLAAADLVIVVAGMEGALASALGGLVGAPVIAVPTSTGYGAALEGVTALLAMLTSCAAGLTVVNIDSGFSAAMAAHRYAHALTRIAPARGAGG